MRFISKLVSAIAVIGLLNVSLLAQDFDAENLQKRIYDAIEKISPAVVAIQGRGHTFSGVIVSPEGHVLSAGHTIQPNARYRVILSDERVLAARGKGSNARLDCALLKIEGESDLPYVELGDSSTLVKYQPCVSISHPGGYDRRRGPVVRFGHILRRSTRNLGMVQSTAIMEPGDSGGGLFDLNGRLIAIHSRIGRADEQNYEVPINLYKESWEQLITASNFSIPGVPRIGFHIENLEDQDGVKITHIVEDSLAESSGFEVGDIITSINDREIRSIRRLETALASAFKQGVTELGITVNRDDEEKEIAVPFEKKDQSEIPESVLSSKKLPKPKPISELNDFPNQFQTLENQLDDCSAVIASQLAGDATRARATRIKGTNFLVSKNSRIGNKPYIVAGEKRIELEIKARDSKNDLILLVAPSENRTGIEFDSTNSKPVSIGTLLLSPDPTNDGEISVSSTLEFPSRKNESKGYLGVRPGNHDDGAVLVEVHPGAAKRAGLEEGDIILKLNSTTIDSGADVFRFMAKTDANSTIKATVKRGDDEFEKEIVLGSPPNRSNHVAEQMNKSLRRDGFTSVISHDARLRPSECGGPLFDLKGNFVGINIARNSRVRCYTIPKRLVKEFVEANSK